MSKQLVWSKFQIPVFRRVRQADANLMIGAVAGCLSGKTLVGLHRAGKSWQAPIAHLHHMHHGGVAGGKIWSPLIETLIRSVPNKQGIIQLCSLNAVMFSGEQLTWRLKTVGGKSIRATARHRFLTPNGWRRLERLKPGDTILVDGGKLTKTKQKKKQYRRVFDLHHHPFQISIGARDGVVSYHRVVVEAKMNEMSLDTYLATLRRGETGRLRFLSPNQVVHHEDHDHLNNQLSNLKVVSHTWHKRHHAKDGWKNVQARVVEDEVRSITTRRTIPTYDIVMENQKYPNFIANGFVVHNSGKTTTGVHATLQSPLTPRLAVAYNVHTAATLLEKFGGKYNTKCAASNYHSLGFRTVRENFGRRITVQKFKYDELVDEWLKSPANSWWREIMSYMQARIHLIELIEFRRLTLGRKKALDRYGITYHKQFWRAALDILDFGDSNLFARHGVIDFTDMLWLPYSYDFMPPRYRQVTADEAQDLSPAARSLVLKCIWPGEGRFLGLGDPCQPGDTLVVMGGKGNNRWNTGKRLRRKRIDRLRVGDKVVTYNQGGAHFNSAGYAIEGITKRHFDGNLVVVTTEGGKKQSRYTPNHHCYASFASLRGRSVVYLMRRGDQFRIGKSQLEKHASTISGRLKNEKADAVWILTVHKSRKRALLMEQAIAGKFGIPQLRFCDTMNSNVMNCRRIDKAWEYIGSNYKRGVRCLKAFKRDVRYPLKTSRSGRAQFSMIRPCIIHASNLVSGILLRPFLDQAVAKRSEWIPIKVHHEAYTGDVYSLTVGGPHLYVADGLVTHNCQSIMQWAFAAPDSFEITQQLTNAEVLPLSICYRCPTSHIELARELVPQIEPRDGAPVGTIAELDSYEALLERVKPGLLVICRRNAPVINFALMCIRNRINARVRGRDVGKALVSYLREAKKAYGWSSPEDSIASYRDDRIRRVAMFIRPSAKIRAIEEQWESAQACLEGIKKLDPFDTFIKLVEYLFADKDEEGQPATKVWCSSIHRAKGLEAEMVAILEFEGLGDPQPGCTDEEAQQEQNLRYVALTRSKNILYLVTDYRDRKKRRRGRR